MNTAGSRGPARFRLWIATYADWRPLHWNQAPPRATALELVEDRVYGAQEAALFLEGFNRSMLGSDRSVWAVAVPVHVRYEGDVQPGMSVVGHVFARPADSLVAAAAIQAQVRARAWPAGARVRVRAGIHTGRPTLTDAGYVGLSVHTVARISSLAHGGQVLVSGATRQAVQALPGGITLNSLGWHRLAGLPGQEELFQLAAPGIGGPFPPLRNPS